MKFILVRHTTTDWNLKKCIQGHTDRELVAQGKAEAQKLAELLAALGATLIVSSNLKRARQTAEIISEYLNIPLELDRRLRECKFGKMEGMTLSEVDARFGSEVVESFKNLREYNYSNLGGENRDEVFTRHIESLNEIKAKHETQEPQEPVIIIGHGRGLNTLLTGLNEKADFKVNEYRILFY